MGVCAFGGASGVAATLTLLRRRGLYGRCRHLPSAAGSVTALRAQQFDAQPLLVGRHVAFDHIPRCHLQAQSGHIGMHRLAGHGAIHQHCRAYLAGAELRQPGAGAQQRVTFVEHVIDQQQAGVRQVEGGDVRIPGQRGLRVEQAEIVGIALQAQRIKRPGRRTWLRR